MHKISANKVFKQDRIREREEQAGNVTLTRKKNASISKAVVVSKENKNGMNNLENIPPADYDDDEDQIDINVRSNNQKKKHVLIKTPSEEKSNFNEQRRTSENFMR